MNITATTFEANIHASQPAGSETYGRYTLHNIDVFNEIKIDDEVFQAVYQTGTHFLHNDYNYPSPELALSDEGGTSHVLYVIGNMYESDFDDSDIMKDILLDVSEQCKSIKTGEDVYQVWDFLRNQLPDLRDFVG